MRSLASKLIVAAVLTATSAFALVYANAVPFTINCTNSTGCYNGSKLVQTGKGIGCVTGGTNSCTSSDCVYGPWKSVSC